MISLYISTLDMPKAKLSSILKFPTHGEVKKSIVCQVLKQSFDTQQSQKHYMVTGSLCLNSFVDVESHVILVVIKQRPRRS